jgi:CP family cyanate transporter-like MFS transporter
VLNIASVPGALVLPWLSDHVGGRRPWLVGTGVLYLVGALGFVRFPGAAWVWAILAGVASGAMFALVMTLPLDIEHDGRRVGALVGMMLGLGYVIGAASPLVLGAVRDATGSFTGSLWLIVGFCAALVIGVAAAPVRRLGGASAPRGT